MRMIGGNLGVAAAVLAASALGIGGQQLAATVPTESARRLVKAPTRKDKRKASRRAVHARGYRRRGDKLTRRLRRNAQLGRMGAF